MAEGQRRGGGLAARFRAAVQDEDRRQRKDEAKIQQVKAQSQDARRALLADLVAFAGDVGFVKVREKDQVVAFRFGDRIIHFEPEGDEDRVRVRIEGMENEENCLYREAHLSNRWVWSRIRGRNEDRLPLFDSGLEELMVHGLGLPRPGDTREIPDKSDRKL